jgi:GDP-4-dehydro-6-deoxy-D-mannose reductase
VRIFVTGGHGFVGAHLLDHLHACGDEVIAPHQAEVDLDDQDALIAAVTRAAPDAIIHLAALAHVGESWADPGRTFAVNAVGTLHVLEAARRITPLPRVLLIGSAEVYGPVRPDEVPLREEHLLNPATPYAASKVAAEFLGMQYHAGWGVPVVRSRSFNHIGPGQAARFLVSDIANRIADAKKTGSTAPILVGNITTQRDYTDVRDVVRAYRLMITDGVPGEVYNVCSGRGVSGEMMAQRMFEIAEVELNIEIDPSLVRPVDVPVLIGDNSRLRAATGWEPQIALDDTLRDVLNALMK